MGERKTIYWIKSPPSSSTCQWGYSLFSIQPFFHHLAIWGLDHSVVYNIPSSTLIFTFFLQDISLRDFCNFINCLLELSYPWYCRSYAEGNHRSCSTNHEDQDHCSPRAQILRMDRWLHPCLPVHLPADVDQQAGIRRVRPIHRPPQMLLNYYSKRDSISAPWKMILNLRTLSILSYLCISFCICTVFRNMVLNYLNKFQTDYYKLKPFSRTDMCKCLASTE